MKLQIGNLMNPRAILFGLLLAICTIQVSGQVVINEVLVRPTGDPVDPIVQSMVNCPAPATGAEWVELYNSSQCDTIDLSCFILATRTGAANDHAFAFPAGSKIAPLGFLTIGPPGTPNLDIDLSTFCGTANLCGGDVWTLPNTTGWIHLYDNNGASVSGLYWSSVPSDISIDPAFATASCTPGACVVSTALAAPVAITDGSVEYGGAGPQEGFSLHRSQDGGSLWQETATPTPGACNGTCRPGSDLSLVIDSTGDERCLLGNGFIRVAPSGGTGNYRFFWNTTAETALVGNLSAGIYSVTVTDDAGCQFTITDTLDNIGNPVTVVIDPSEATVFEGDEIQLTATSTSSIISYTWTPVLGLSCSSCSAPISRPRDRTTYTVTAVDMDSCIGTATAEVAVLRDENSVFAATAFTPNADGRNDLFLIRSDRLESMELRIYDRWGKEVHVSTDINQGWDGRDKNGKELNAGVYAYFVKAVLQNGKARDISGNVTLLR